MNRDLSLADHQIFLFRTRSFRKNQSRVSVAAQKLFIPPLYSCTSNIVTEHGLTPLGHTTPLKLREAIDGIRQIHQIEVGAGRLVSITSEQFRMTYSTTGNILNAVVGSDENFKLDYLTKGSHGEVYRVTEFGMTPEEVESFSRHLFFD